MRVVITLHTYIHALCVLLCVEYGVIKNKNTNGVQVGGGG